MESNRANPVCLWHPSLHARICVARGLCLRRLEAARYAVCDVDATGAFHSRWHRHHSLFHFAQTHAEALPGLLAGCSVRLCFLPTLRHLTATHMPELRPCCRARLGELPELRDKVAVTAWSCGLTPRLSASKIAVSPLAGGSIFLGARFLGRMQAKQEEALCHSCK